jgi:hypothetical protein
VAIVAAVAAATVVIVAVAAAATVAAVTGVNPYNSHFFHHTSLEVWFFYFCNEPVKVDQQNFSKTSLPICGFCSRRVLSP